MSRPASGPVAKISPPTLGRVLRRPRLFRLLDRARKHPILWVTGPPGSGKTTLVASYLAARRLRSLWYQADEGDADLAAFVYYMGLAAQRVTRRKGKPPPLLTPEHRGAVGAFARHYFRTLYARLGAPCALVVDDYHAVAPEAPLHDVLREGLGERPPGAWLIVISRAYPPPQLARLRVAGGVAIVGWDALRFSLTEWRAVARLRPTRPLRAAALRELHGRMSGWVAGLVLAAEQRVAERGAPRFSEGDETGSVFDYFAEEVFRRTGRAEQALLLETAFLPSMTAATAERLTGSREAGRLLFDLYRRNYFIQRQVASEPVYQYHRLFREFLLAQARGAFGPNRLRTLRRRAAGVLARDGKVEHAVSLFAESGDFDSLARLLLEHAPSLVAQGRIDQLEAWISRLPLRITARSPWLQYWLGMCHLTVAPDRSQGHFEQAYQGFDRAGDATGRFLAWSGVVDSILYQWGDFTRLDPWIRRLDALMRQHPGPPAGDVETRIASSMLAALMFRQPQHRAIGEWAGRAVQRALAAADPSSRILVGYHPILYRFWTGDLAGAAGLMSRLRDAGEAGEALPLARIMWQVIDAIYQWHRGDGDACLGAVTRGLDIAERTGVHIFDVQLLGQGVFAALLGTDRPAARRFLQRMAATLDRTRRLDVGFYHFLAGWEALRAGDVPRALHDTEQGLELTIAMGTPFPEALHHVAMAQVLHEQGHRDRAADHLRRGQVLGDRMRSAMLQYMAALIAAHFAFARGDRPEGLAALRRAMELGRRQGFRYTAWWPPDVVADLCAKALETGIEVDYAQELVRRHGLVADEPPVTVAAWPWPVRVSTLGSFAVLAGDRPVSSSRKAPQRPMALLKALVAFGGREVAEDQLVDALWPEAEGDAGHRALKTTLHRLRQLLELERAVLHRGGRVSLDPRVCWTDTWAFQRLLEDAERAARRGDAAAERRHTEQALALYRGPFLDKDARIPWTSFLRERLRSQLVRAVGRLGQHLETAGDWARAGELYERGLDVEDLVEEFYRRLMTCALRLGRRADALATYRRCRATLAAALGVAPSSATEALYRSIAASP